MGKCAGVAEKLPTGWTPSKIARSGMEVESIGLSPMAYCYTYQELKKRRLFC
jgi:hypothetical protein